MEHSSAPHNKIALKFPIPCDNLIFLESFMGLGEATYLAVARNEVINLSGQMLTPDDVVSMLAAAASGSTKALMMEFCLIGDLGVRAILPFLQHTRTLEIVRLTGNDISDTGIIELAASLANTPTIKDLHLGRNAFSAAGIRAIALLLKTNQSIATLNVEMNGLNDDDIEELSVGLVDNHSLVNLHLAGNKVSAVGRDRLIESITSPHLRVHGLGGEFRRPQASGAGRIAMSGR